MSKTQPERSTLPAEFESGEFRYRVVENLVEHECFETLWLVNREKPATGRCKLVILREVSIEEGTESQRRVMEEMALANLLCHPNIALTYAWVTHEEKTYIIQEYVRGFPLYSAMEMASLLGQRLSPGLCVYVAAEVAHALDFAHALSDWNGLPLHIVHRAVGPMRIWLGQNGEVKLMNFGAAYSDLLGRLSTPYGLLRGDPAYVAPEILRRFALPEPEQRDPLTPRGLDGRADIFSLGLVLLEALTACYLPDGQEALWHGTSTPKLTLVRTERPSFINFATLAGRVLSVGHQQVEAATEGLPEPLRLIIAKALESEPAKRYARAGEMRDALRSYLGTLAEQFDASRLALELSTLHKQASASKNLPGYGVVVRRVLPLPVDVAEEGR